MGVWLKGAPVRTKAAILPPVARVLAILAGTAGVGAGLLTSTFGADYICFPSCPSQAWYLRVFALTTLLSMAPCLALAVLALLIYLGYCIATGHLRAMMVPVLVFVGGGVLLAALALVGLALLDFSVGALENWEAAWGLALMVVSAAWSALTVWLARVRPAAPVTTRVAQ